jgi:hypothetical protein
MSDTLKVLASAKTGDELKAKNDAARKIVMNDIGIRVDDLDAKDYAKLTAAMAKFKKPAEWVISFDGSWFGYFARVGTDKASKIGISFVQLSFEKDIEKRRAILATLLKLKAATQPQVDEFMKNNPDPEAVAEAKKLVDNLTGKIKQEENLIQEFKGFTFETGTPGFFGGLEKWTTKHSWSHYVDFLSDIKANFDAQGIFDKYIKQGCSFPVNLDGGTAAALEKDLHAGKKPNFAKAFAQILRIVDGKIIAKYNAETIAALQKVVADDKKELQKAQQHFAAIGGK